MTTTRTAALVLSLAAASGLLAACGNGGGSTSTTTPASGGTTAATTTTSAQSSETATAGLSACTTSQLHVTLGQSGAAAGTLYRQVDFRNRSGRACTLTGYPGVSFADASGQQVGASASRNPTTPSRTVTLAPGQVAHAVLGVPDYGNFPASRCHAAQVSSVRVYPPNERASVLLSDRETVCTTVAGRATITPVQPGA